MRKVVFSAMRRIRAHHPVTDAVELLEPRQLLSVSTNSQGFTVVTPPAGSRIIYCSTSGSDKNSGLSPSAPVQTLAKGESLLRSGTGDELLLKCGDVFSGNFIFWTKSGASAQSPMVLGSYGTGARPEILTGTSDGIETGSVGAPVVNYLDVLGINFIASGRDPNMTKKPSTTTNPVGIYILTASNGITVENCEFQYYDIGVSLDKYLGPIENATIVGNTFVNSYSSNTHAQGLYAFGVTNLTIDNNLFDQDGYETQLGINPTVFNQECYLAYNDVNCVVENNIFSRASSAGLEDRPGGIVENNLFIDDPIGMTFGLVNGADTTVGGVTGVISGNVFTGGADIGSLPEGQAIQIGNTKPGVGALISDNVFTQGLDNGVPAIEICCGKAQIDPQDSVGANNLTFTGNVFNNWSTGIEVASGLTPGGKGITALNDLTITNNKFNDLGASIENHQASYASVEHISGNIYQDANDWLVNDALVPAQGGTMETKAVLFPDPERTVATYDSTIGGSGTVSDFLARATTQSETSWNPAYFADTAISYFDEGFGMKPVSGTVVSTPVSVGTTPTPVTTSTTTTQSATSTIKATNYTAKYGIVPDGFGGIGTNGGDWVEYANVNFGTSGVTKFEAEIAGLSKYVGTIQIRLGSATGKVIGSLKVAGTGAWNKYDLQTTSVTKTTGVQNLYLTFVGGGGVGNIMSFNFA